MSNPQKSKGDRFERAAVAHLCRACPDLVLERPTRMLGAGRKDDVGDLHVFPDVSVQVKALNDISRAVRQSVQGAVRQQANAGNRLHLGMVPVIRARTSAVNWLFAAQIWPAPVPETECPVFTQSIRAIAYVRDDDSSSCRSQRVAMIRRSDAPQIYLGTTEAWVTAYRARRGPRFSDLLNALSGGAA